MKAELTIFIRMRTDFAVYLVLYAFITSSSCNYFTGNERLDTIERDSVVTPVTDKEQLVKNTTFIGPVIIPAVADRSILYGKEVSIEQLLAYAKTLLGTPYKYASINPTEGLDCSGFITHVYNHFSIQVPRLSIDFTNYGRSVYPADAQPGDLILFTGTDTLTAVVGHMGIVTAASDDVLEFIHSTSGKAYAVTISAVNPHYKRRFVKVIRIPYYTALGF